VLKHEPLFKEQMRVVYLEDLGECRWSNERLGNIISQLYAGALWWGKLKGSYSELELERPREKGRDGVKVPRTFISVQGTVGVGRIEAPSCLKEHQSFKTFEPTSQVAHKTNNTMAARTLRIGMVLSTRYI
jgi:hypothetical protein